MLIASGISVLLVAGFVGGAVALANARKEKQRLEQQLQQHEGDSAHIISGPDFEGTDRVE